MIFDRAGVVVLWVNLKGESQFCFYLLCYQILCCVLNESTCAVCPCATSERGHTTVYAKHVSKNRGTKQRDLWRLTNVGPPWCSLNSPSQWRRDLWLWVELKNSPIYGLYLEMWRHSLAKVKKIGVMRCRFQQLSHTRFHMMKHQPAALTPSSCSKSRSLIEKKLN